MTSFMNRIFGFFWMFTATSFFAFCSQADRISIDTSSAAGLLFQGGVEVFLLNNQNQDNTPEVPEKPKEITSFRFQAVDNFFTTDFVGEISGSEITVQVPFGAIRRLKAAFVSTGVKVEVNGVVQRSGQTVNDFSSPLTYRVTASDDSVQDYTVQVVRIFRLTDAGQTNCYFSFCSDDPGQDADYSTGVPAAFQSNVVMPGYTPQPVTIDRQTGLIWKYCSATGNSSSCSLPTYAYTHSMAVTYCNDLNQMNVGLGYAGIQGWRLPEIEELMTLSTHKTPSGAYIDLAEFPNGSGTLWSNTTNASNVTEAWTFNFAAGLNPPIDKSWGNIDVRCVSGGVMPDRTFSDLNNGTVRDDRTTLVWQKCSVGQTWSPASPQCASGAVTSHNFISALYTCRNLNLAGRTWRLPNVHELRSLLDFTNSSSGAKIDSTAFPNTPNTSQYNTSNSIPASQIFRVNFTNAAINTTALSTQSYVRCVSDGP